MRPSVWVVCMLSASFCVAVARFVICSSDENCAIWAMLSLSSEGFIGSWFFICATISFRKSSLPRMLSVAFLVVADVSAVADVVVAVVGSIAMVRAPWLGEDVDERAVRQLDRPVGDGKVDLGGVARGARAAVAAAVPLLAAGRAGAGAGRLVTGGAD